MQTSAATETKFDEQLLDLSSRIDAYEGYSHAHGLQIAEIAESIGQRFGMSPHDRYFMHHAALLHDVGEFVMKRPYLSESRSLTDVERLDMQRHSVIGEQDVAKRGLPRSVQLLVRWHHEWWNGLGYPDRLIGQQIPLAARIIRLADTYSAITSDRPNRRAASPDAAKQYLREFAGLEFDPRVVKTFLEIE